MVSFEQAAAYIFSGKDTGHIDKAAFEQAFLSHKMHDRGEKSGTSIDGEHPEGRIAGQFEVSHAKGVQAGPEDFQAPANDSASKKIFYYHKDRMCRFERNMPASLCSFQYDLQIGKNALIIGMEDCLYEKMYYI